MARGRPARTTVYARLDGAVTDLQERLGGLPTPREAESIWSDIWHQEAHHSTALEGNTLVMREVEALLDHGRAVGAKPLREYLEVRGYAQAARWVYGQALEPGGWSTGALVSIQEVRHVHHLAMAQVWGVAPHEDAGDQEGPGQFRQHEIEPFPSGMTPPSWPMLPSLVADWLDEVEAARPQLSVASRGHPLPEVIARLHHRFECIHPFLDGNGRAGRLLLNLLLVRTGFPPVIVLKQQRSRYLRAMARADGGDHGPLGEILARAMYDNLVRFIVPNIAGPARMVPLAALADHEFSVGALRQAAQRGRLDAMQGSDGVWLSSRHAVNAYAKLRHRRRPAHEAATSG